MASRKGGNYTDDIFLSSPSYKHHKIVMSNNKRKYWRKERKEADKEVKTELHCLSLALELEKGERESVCSYFKCFTECWFYE